MIMPKAPLSSTIKSSRPGPYPSNAMVPHPSHHQPLNPTTVGNERPSTAWSHDDDNLLKISRAQGMNWAPISQTHFPKKTPNACRKRHERLMEKQNQEKWDDGVQLEVLAQAYIEVREMMWKILADKVGEKWQHVETKCMEKGLKTLTSAARSRRNKDSSNSPTFPHDENDLDDSGLPPEPPSSDAGNQDLQSGSLHQSNHYQTHPSSHHGNSANTTPGTSHAILQSGYHSRNSISSTGTPYFQSTQASNAQRQPTLPSFSSGFAQLPNLALAPMPLQFPSMSISASY